MLFDQNELNELFKIIEAYHIVFIGQNIGKDILTKDDLILLKKFGIDSTSFPKISLINYAFKFGVLAEYIGTKNASELSYKDFQTYIKKGRFIPLTKTEEHILKAIKTQSYHDIKNLGDKIKKELVIENIKSILETTIRDRESIRFMMSELGHKTGMWGRDFGRISDYLMHSTYELGRAESLEEKHGKDVLVYKQVHDGACKYCIKLYLTAGLGSPARIFKLSELKANGSNIGKKQSEWLAVLGPLHPFCRCTLYHYEPEYDFNPKTFLYDKPREFIRKVATKTKIRVTIGDKVYER